MPQTHKRREIDAIPPVRPWHCPLPQRATRLPAPLALIVSFSGFVEALARHRELNPDTPPMRRKVTETI